MTSSPWTDASLVFCASQSPPRSLHACIPSFEQRHGCREGSLSPVHTADCLILLRLHPEARCRLCASPSHGSTLFARLSPRALSLSGCLTLLPRWRASLPPEVTLHWTSRAWVQCCIPSRPSEILCSDTRTFPCSCPPSLSWWDSPPVFFFSTGSWGPFHTSRASSRPASPPHAPFEPRRDPTILLWYRPSTFPLESNSAPAQSVHLHSSDCTSSVFGEVMSKGLACVPLAMCIVEDAWPASPTCWQNVGCSWGTHSFSVTPVSCVTKRVEDIMPALQAYHARERELQCMATEVVQEPGSSPYLLFVQDCAEQCALAISDDKVQAGASCGSATTFRADLFDFWGSTFCLAAKWVEGPGCHRSHPAKRRPLPVAAFVRCRCHKFPRAENSHFHSHTAHPKTFWILCFLSTPEVDLETSPCLPFYKSPCAEGSRFLRRPICQRSSILLHQCCKQWISSNCHSTQVHTGSRGERIDLVWDDGEFAPIPLRSPFIHRFLHHQRHWSWLSFSHPSDSLGLLLSFSGSPRSASSLCSLGGWSTLTLDSAGRGCGSDIATDLPVTSCSLPAPSRELDASSFNDLAIRPLLRILDSHVSGSLLVPGSLNSLETQPLEHFPCEAHSPGDDWWVNIWRMHTSVTSSLREIHTDVDISGKLPVWRQHGSFHAQHEFCVASILSTELSHCPASDHSWGCSNVRLAIEWSAAEVDPIVEPCAKVSSSRGKNKNFSPCSHTRRWTPLPLTLSLGVLPSAPTINLFLSCAACSIIHSISGWNGPISVLKFDSVLLFKVLMKPFTMFTLPSAVLLLPLLKMHEDGDAAFSPQPRNLLSKSENGWLVVTLHCDCLTAQPIQPIRHTLRNPWCSIALSQNCHRQSEPILRQSSYENRNPRCDRSLGPLLPPPDLWATFLPFLRRNVRFMSLHFLARRPDWLTHPLLPRHPPVVHSPHQLVPTVVSQEAVPSSSESCRRRSSAAQPLKTRHIHCVSWSLYPQVSIHTLHSRRRFVICSVLLILTKALSSPK